MSSYPTCTTPRYPDADFDEADPDGAEEDYRRYRAECQAVDAALEGATLDDTFTFREQTISVRWDVAAPRGGIRAPQRARRPAPRGHRRLGRPVGRAQGQRPAAGQRPGPAGPEPSAHRYGPSPGRCPAEQRQGADDGFTTARPLAGSHATLRTSDANRVLRVRSR